jgi:serine protease Do
MCEQGLGHPNRPNKANKGTHCEEINQSLRLGTLLLGGMGLSAVTGLALSPASNNGDETGKAPLQIHEDDKPLVRDVKDGTSFASIVLKVAPSVVKVFVTMKSSENPISNPDMEFFRRFFGGDGLNQMNPDQPNSPTEHGLGSGVIVASDGYILTNNHVVSKASEIQSGGPQ